MVELFALLAVLAIFVCGEAHVYRRKRELLARAGIEFPYWCLVTAPPVIFAGMMGIARLVRSDWDALMILLVSTNLLLFTCFGLRFWLVRGARRQAAR